MLGDSINRPIITLIGCWNPVDRQFLKKLVKLIYTE